LHGERRTRENLLSQRTGAIRQSGGWHDVVQQADSPRFVR
jgi:hypothetical protein